MQGKSVLFVLAVAVIVHVNPGLSATLGAQTPAPESHEHHQPPPTPAPAPHVHDAGGMALFPVREASGTSWLPERSPMYGIHQEAGDWQVMWHGNGFAQFLHDAGERGHTQVGSINWAMGMARRELRGGRFGVRGMISLEPATIRGCGYPDLLASGEICDGQPIHDRQHPHDFLMELAAEYDRPAAGDLRWQLYGGLAGEPALGPVAYPHRTSALANPLAPIAHHWLDATHITFGILTGGVYNSRWKAEASLFNGREPDERRWSLDLAPLDSVSGRVWFAPTPELVVQLSAGHLNEAEAGHPGEPRVDVNRITASATYHRQLDATTLLATTVAWGRNAEPDGASHALLAEMSLARDERAAWFGRFEVAGKPAHDLDVHGGGVFTVAKLQGGYSRYFLPWRGLVPGFGGSLSLGFVPRDLEPVYGSRVNAGLSIFLTIRPRAHLM